MGIFRGKSHVGVSIFLPHLKAFPQGLELLLCDFDAHRPHIVGAATETKQFIMSKDRR